MAEPVAVSRLVELVEEAGVACDFEGCVGDAAVVVGTGAEVHLCWKHATGLFAELFHYDEIRTPFMAITAEFQDGRRN